MQQKFDFQYSEIDGSTRPIIPIEIRRGSAFVFFEALIDSGADFCLFDCEIAEELGITNIASGEKIDSYGIDDKIIAVYKHEVELCIDTFRYMTTVAFAERELPGNYGILGQRGFFSRFKVVMDYQQNLIELTAKTNSSAPASPPASVPNP